MHPFVRTAFCTALALAAGFAHAIEFRSVAAPSILYDAPSDRAKRLYIVAPGTPVEVVVSLDKWAKVRDAGGALTWIERSALSERRTIIVNVPRAVVRRQPVDDAPAVFEAARDLVLEYAEAPAAGWIKVRHRDGGEGFLRVGEVWGL